MTKTEAKSRTSADIQKEIAELGEMEVQKVAELEKKRASLLSGAEFNKLIIAEATGSPKAKATLVHYDAKKSDAQRMRDLIDAIRQLLPELRREQKQAELIESMEKEKGLGKKNEPIEQKIREHLAEAARLFDEEWIPREKERYSLRVKWGSSGGRTPKQQAYDWLPLHFGAMLHPYLEKTRRRRGEEKIEEIARQLMKDHPDRFKTLEDALVFAARGNVDKPADIYGEYCVGRDSYLTEQEYVEKHERPSATQLILKGVEAAPRKSFTERLDRVLQIWPELGEEWLRQR